MECFNAKIHFAKSIEKYCEFHSRPGKEDDKIEIFKGNEICKFISFA